MILFRRSAAIAVFALVVATAAFAQSKENAITTPQALGHFTTYYFQQPRPDLVTSAIRYLEEQHYPQTDSQVAPLVGFFSEIFGSNPKMMSEWKADAEKTSGGTKRMLTAAIQFSQRPGDLTHFDPASARPSQNDVCWGAFFASGKEMYINALVQRLAYLGERKSLNLYLTAATAQWSLSTNAKQHPAVRKMLEKMRSTLSPSVQKALDEALWKDPKAIEQSIIAVVRAQKNAKVW